MPWVFDASLAAAWCFEDEHTAETDALARRLAADPATVPNLFHLEIANVLTFATRKKHGRITLRERDEFLGMLSKSAITTDDSTAERAWSTTRALADRFNLTLYDAAYLELAVRLQVELATLDDDLRKAARSAGISVIP